MNLYCSIALAFGEKDTLPKLKMCRYFWEFTKMRQIYLEKVISADLKQKLKMVCLWCRPRNMPDNGTIRKTNIWSFNIGKSWKNYMLKLFDLLSLQEPRTDSI